jgi:signal transduction histidine kinase
LTLILHFSGGIENPMIIFFFLHMIIASSIFSTFGSYLHTTFVLILVAMLAFLECYSIIPHYHLEGFINHDLYQNKFFIYGSGFIFITTSLLLVHLTHLIVSRSIKIEENYVKTNDELEKKDKLQNEYVLRVTHDIKGHLGAILSCLEVIRSTIIGSLNEKQEEFVNRAFERTELLANFVKDLLNLTKKRLKHDTEFEEFLLKDLITKVVSSVQILAKDKSIEFTIFIDNNIHTITGDPFTIEELYSNLLLNAIKYTLPKGRIELSVRNRPDHIVTEISDSGIGIPKEEIPKVFDEFYRATNVPKDIRTGSGLGLSIVKQIVENHKGRIWVNSEVGVWTKFTFTLPKNPNLID